MGRRRCQSLPASLRRQRVGAPARRLRAPRRCARRLRAEAQPLRARGKPSRRLPRRQRGNARRRGAERSRRLRRSRAEWRVAGRGERMGARRIRRRALHALFLRFAKGRRAMSTRFDAVVVGAGPAGASTAILLARAGWSVALVERQRFPRRKVCGESLAASNLPLLDALGIGEAFSRLAGAELRRVALMRGRETIVASLPPAEAPAHRYGRALGREHLDALLAAQAEAAGATLFQPWALQAIEGSAGRFRLRLRTAGAPGDACELEAGLIVAAHGSWEPLSSQRAVLRRARRSSDLFAFKANFRSTSIPQDLLPVLSFRGGYGGM